jgi:hypothetical protein
MTLSTAIPQIPSISKIRSFLIVIQSCKNEYELQDPGNHDTLQCRF